MTQAFINSSELLIQKLDDIRGDSKIASDTRTRLSARCFDTVIEHHKSIILLIHHEFFASAFALARPQFEAFIRGVWLQKCATDREVDKFLFDKKNTKEFHDLIAEIEKCDGYDDGILVDVKKQAWKLLNSFTHGGIHQIARRFKDNSLEPNYKESEFVSLMKFADSIGMLANLHFVFLIGEQNRIAAVFEIIKKYGHTAK